MPSEQWCGSVAEDVNVMFFCPKTFVYIEILALWDEDAEADLGMFSMFGRTGAPTKKGPPQEDRQIFAT